MQPKMVQNATTICKQALFVYHIYYISAVFDCSGTGKDAEETKVMMGKDTLLNVQRLIENQISMLMIYLDIKELKV